MRLLEGLSETLRFSIFSSLFLLSLYFLSYNFLYHKVYSLFLFLHPKNKTLAHLPLSVGNHPRVVLHHKLSSYVSFILSKKSLHFLPYGGMQQGVIKASLGYAPVSFSNVLTSSSPSFAVRCGGAIGEMKIYKEPKIYKRGI